MSYNESNNDFYSWNGIINRKDYAINMFILISIYVLVHFIKFETFIPFFKIKFLFYALMLIVQFLMFVVIFAALSVVYRRIAAISCNKSQKFKDITKKLYLIFFVFPVVYIEFIRYFLNGLNFITYPLDITAIVMLPVALILAIIIGIIK